LNRTDRLSTLFSVCGALRKLPVFPFSFLEGVTSRGERLERELGERPYREGGGFNDRPSPLPNYKGGFCGLLFPLGGALASPFLTVPVKATGEGGGFVPPLSPPPAAGTQGDGEGAYQTGRRYHANLLRRGLRPVCSPVSPKNPRAGLFRGEKALWGRTGGGTVGRRRKGGRSTAIKAAIARCNRYRRPRFRGALPPPGVGGRGGFKASPSLGPWGGVPGLRYNLSLKWEQSGWFILPC